MSHIFLSCPKNHLRSWWTQPLGWTPLAAVYFLFLPFNCPVLVGSRPHNGSIQAFLTRWLGKKEKCPLSPSASLSRSFSAPCISRRVVLADRGVVSKSSSRLLSPHLRPLASDASVSPSLSDPGLNPCITQRAITIQPNRHRDSYCLFALFMSVYSLRQMAP